MNELHRAVKLLQPHMSDDERDTWLTLAFADQRAIYDAIERSGAAAHFTVRCVRTLINRGCVGSRHALALLLAVVAEGAGSERQAEFRALIEELDATCVRRDVPPVAPAEQPTRSTILLLAANPANTQCLALDEEARQIEQKIRAAAYRDELDLRTAWAVRPDDLLQYLNQYRPHVVHFSGHGEQQAIVLDDDSGQGQPVSGHALRALFALHRERVRLVVLNACYSMAQAQAIVEEVDCAVGMNTTVGDRAAIVFAAAFYRKLGFGASVAAAFAEARVALLLEGIGEENTPELLVRTGVDAGSVYLAGRARHAVILPGGGNPPALSASAGQRIPRHSPGNLDDYRRSRVAEWSQPRYALDRRFTRLTLLLDQGPDAQGVRWQAQARREPYSDLREVLAETDAAPALVLLGPPGCGKSTLLRRLELDLALDALRGSGAARVSFFVPLNRHRAARPSAVEPAPREWLAQEWERRYPVLPPFDELLASGTLVLLLDAINEIPHTDAADYRRRIAEWRDFLADLPAGTRAIVSCRSLDYSASLSTRELGVPHVRVEALSDAQVEAFLRLYRPERAAALWQQLRGTRQLDLFRSPYYLRLLLAQDGDTPLNGRAALFTGFVRQCLEREIDADNPLFRPEFLLSARDHQRCVQRDWRQPLELPEQGVLLPALGRFAYALQARRAPGEASLVRVPYDDALALLGTPASDLLHAGVALQVLEVQSDDVFYVHQLLQEYFAARVVARETHFALAASAWRAGEMTPTLPEVVASLADSDPLPAAPATGWEETFVLASALAANPESFISALLAVNLPLAGHCAAQPELPISRSLRQRLQQGLIERSRDPAADLRARIAAARALGQLGDPRYERRRGPHGDYLLPPVVEIPAGTYRIGSDEGLYNDEAPEHPVTLAAFAIGRFPVTNAEWRLFVEAGGYDDERWWQGEVAKRWQRGEGTGEGPKGRWRRDFRYVRENPEWAERELRDGRITTQQAEFWEEIRKMPDDDFEDLLTRRYPGGRQSEPAFWNDPAYNDLSQPVVGVCWYEARAYCAWLSAQSGQPWRLPSEAEWEAAARGPAARCYAWGEEFDSARCNTFESHLRMVTPVGVFPDGDTSEGVADITGNVWEWMSSAYERYPYAADLERGDPERMGARRVVRGGSWDNDRVRARGAYRYHADPGHRDDSLGLRLVCFSPIQKR